MSRTGRLGRTLRSQANEPPQSSGELWEVFLFVCLVSCVR